MHVKIQVFGDVCTEHSARQWKGERELISRLTAISSRKRRLILEIPKRIRVPCA